MKPVFKLTAAGRDITDSVNDRLISISYRDEAETKSDRLTITLDDRPRRSDGAYLAFPNIGARLDFAIGYEATGIVPMGSFTVDEITYSGPPATVTIAAKAAGMEGPYRSPASQSWDDTTLGAIADAIAGEHGMTLVADPDLSSVPVPHADQTQESPMAFISRLAERHDGVAKPVAGRLVLARKGAARAVTGQPLPGLTLRPGDVGKWTYSYSARDEAGAAQPDGGEGEPTGGGVKSVYWDKDQARMVEVVEGSPPYERVRFAASDRGDATAQATSRKAQKDRSRARFSFDLPGNPRLMAEQRLTLTGFRPGVPTGWRITSVDHKLDGGGGYSCSVEAERWRD